MTENLVVNFYPEPEAVDLECNGAVRISGFSCGCQATEVARPVPVNNPTWCPGQRWEWSTSTTWQRCQEHG